MQRANFRVPEVHQPDTHRADPWDPDLPLSLHFLTRVWGIQYRDREYFAPGHCLVPFILKIMTHEETLAYRYNGLDPEALQPHITTLKGNRARVSTLRLDGHFLEHAIPRMLWQTSSIVSV